MTPDATEQQLLAQIREHPADDAPRLVYADWLASRGDPRGEFILLQCRLAAAPDDEARRKLRTAENRLLKANEANWAAPLLALLPEIHRGSRWPKPPKYAFHRGFIEELTMGELELARLDEIVAVVPTLRILRVDETPLSDFSAHSLAGKLESPALSRLESLELWLTGLGDEGMQDLARCPRLGNLRSLKLRVSVSPDQSVEGDALKLTDAGAACLAASPHLQRLESLDLGHNWLSGEGVRALLAGSWPLRSLDLSYNWRLASLGEAFANATRAPTLRQLALAGATLRPEDAARLARAPCLGQLEELNLDRCSLGAEGLQAFLQAMSLPSLRSLCLDHNSLRDEGALVLAASPAVKQLTSLELGTNYIHPKGIAAIASSPNLASLERLLVNESSKAAPMIELLSKSATLAKARIYVAGRLVKHEEPGGPAGADSAEAGTKKRARKPAAKP